MVKVWNSNLSECVSEQIRDKWKSYWLSLRNVGVRPYESKFLNNFLYETQSPKAEFESDSSEWRLLRLAVLKTKDRK